MKVVERTALLPYSAEAMFDLVNDVAAYEKFLPWCDRSEVLSSNEDELSATLTVARAGVTQSFTTRNLLARPESIHMTLVDGPFSMLDGRWTFTALGEDGCKVEMTLKFDFDNRLINMAVSKVFESAAEKLVDAFCERADQVYG